MAQHERYRPTHTLHLSMVCIVLVAMLSTACTTIDPERQQAQARIRYDLGVVAFQQGELRGALRELMMAVEHDPELPQAHNALGLVYHAIGKLRESRHHYQEAVRLKPDFSEAYNNLGILLIDLEAYDEAIAAFKTALADILYETPSLAEGNMGWAYYKKGEVELGLLHLHNAVATNSKFCRGYGWLMQIGVELDRPDQVLINGKRFEKYCLNDQQLRESIPRHYIQQVHYYVGLGHLKKGDRTAARQTFARCAKGGMELDASGFSVRCAAALRELD